MSVYYTIYRKEANYIKMVKLLIPWLINLKLTGDVDAFLNANNVCRFYTYAYCQGSFLCVWKKCILEWGSDNGPLKMLKCESKEKRNGPILNKNSQILLFGNYTLRSPNKLSINDIWLGNFVKCLTLW